MLNVSNKNKMYLTSLGHVLVKTTLTAIVFILLTANISLAGTTMPSTFTYQGRLMNSSGTAPLAASTTVYFEIRNSSGACLLYSEHQVVNTTLTAGLFSVRIGDGTPTSAVPGYDNDPGYEFSEIFTNKKPFPSVAGSCPGGYTPGATDARILRLHIFDGSSTTTLADQTLTPVPQASVADTIDGVNLQGLTLNWTTATRPTHPVANATHGYNDTLKRFEMWNGAAWAPTTPRFSTAVVGDTATVDHVLRWNPNGVSEGVGHWESTALGTLLGGADGDVSGPFDDLNVEAIQGHPVVNTAPNPGDVLKWVSGAWTPSLDAGGVPQASGAGTQNRLTKWNASDELEDSSVADNGTNVTFSIPLLMGTQQIKNLADPTDLQDAVTKGYLEDYVEPGTVDDQILVWDTSSGGFWKPASFPAGLAIAGTTDRVPKFNASGDNIIDSSISDTGSLVTINNPTVVNGALAANGPLVLKEVADPTLTAGYSKIWVKADNTLWYMDEAGVASQFVFGSGAGEINTASSLGGTASLVGAKSGVDLRFRGLTGSTNVTVTQNANDVTIATTGLQTTLTAGANTDQYLKWNGTSWEPALVSGLISPDRSQNLTINNAGVVTASSEYAVVADEDLAHKAYVDTAVAGVTPGTTIAGGTDNVLPMFNATGDNIENSSVTDNGAAGVNFANSKIQFGGSLFAHTYGTQNTFLGVSSGNQTMTGTGNNVALGRSTLTANTTGASNVAVGNFALTVNTTGGSNTSIGSYALTTNSIGANNTAIGYFASGSSTTGGQNVAVGSQALFQNTTSSNNTAVGTGSLSALVDGANNTAIGQGAGGSANGTSTGNIFVGYLAGPASAGAISDKLYIDNSANNSPLIYGDFANDYVRIHNILELPEIVTPADAAAGYGRVYFKTDGLYIKMGATESKLVTGTGAGEVNTGTSLGGTADVYSTKVGTELRFRGISGGTNITVTENANDITIDATGIPAAGTGTDNTLRWSGTAWVESTGLKIEADGDVVLANAPTQNMHATTKTYVDGVVASLISDVTGGDGITATETTGVIDIDVNVDNTTIEINADALRVKALGIANGHLAADAVTTDKILNGTILFEDIAANGCTATHLMRRNAAGNGWECVAPTSGGTTIAGGTQHVMAKFNAAGDNVVNSILSENATATDRELLIGGVRALSTRGTNNVFLGNAGNNTFTTGSASANVAIGNTSLDSLTTGVRNIGIGSGTLSAVTAGDSNVAVGSGAYEDGTGSSNVALGAEAMQTATTAGSNVAIGTGAMKTIDSGNSNTAVGSDSLFAITTGSNNAALGGGSSNTDSSLVGITTGSSNTAVGFGAGKNATGASSSNLFLGVNTGPASGAAVSDKLYIDNSANNTPLIYGDFANDYVRIHNILELPEILTPADAAAGYGRVYFKTDGLYIKMGATESKLVTGSGAGEVNTASSLGGTASLVGTKSGVDLRFRGLTGSTNVTVTQNANDVTIEATGLQTTLTAGANTDQYLKWNGTSWEPALVSGLISPDRSKNVTINNAGVITSSTQYAVSANADLAHKAYVDTAVAAIAGLPAMTDAQIVVSNGTTPAAVTMSSDATIANTGALTIATGAVTTGKILNGTILFEDIAANGCTTGQTAVRNVGNTAWVCTTAATAIHRTGGNATDLSWYLINTTTPASIPADAAGNLAVGKNTLTAMNNASSDWNTAIGHYALEDMTSGSENIGVGAGAGKNITTGIRNIALGVDTLLGNTTASNNIAIGYQTMMNANSAGANIVIGNQAGGSVTGDSNIALGTYALGNSTDAYANVTMGSSTLYDVTTGDNNTAIGHYAGRYASAATTTAVFLGSNAGPTSATDATNKLYIDNSANNTPLIYGDFTNDYVRIHNILELPEIATPATPASGYGRIYFKTDGLYYRDDGGTENKVASSGASPIRQAGTSNSSTFIGTTSGPASPAASSDFNTSAGALSLDSVLTNSADANTAFGYSTLSAITSGSSNTAVGSSALAVNTVGSNNTAVGGDVFASLSDTSNNSYNTAMGFGAARTILAGSDNVAMGFEAAGGNNYSSPGMSKTTAIGSRALTASNPGQYAGNDAFGYGAMQVLTTGYDNVAVGKESGATITTGGGNLFLGYRAGYRMNVGSSRNIIIGSGYSAVPENGAGPATLNEYNNQLFIDNTQTDTPLIRGDFGTNEITINGQMTANSYFYTSDKRLKKNISTMESPLEKILKLRAVEFDWIQSETHDGSHDLGFVAQEVEKVFPDLVTTNQAGYKSVKYGNIVAPLVGAVQELENMSKMSNAQIAAIDARLVNAERKIASLEEKTSQQQKEIDLLKEQVQLLMNEVKKK